MGLETLDRFGELESGKAWVLDRVGDREVLVFGYPGHCSALLEGVMGWARQQREDGNIFYHCRNTGGREAKRTQVALGK